MDRRSFFKTLSVTPFLTQFLLSSDSKSHTFQLYVIGDSPQLYLPSLLRGLSVYTFLQGRKFAFLNSHPEADKLKIALTAIGWTPVAQASDTDFTISFNPLSHKTAPSFALIKNGKVWDIRTQELYSLWKDMHKSSSSSSLLTTITFKDSAAQPRKGTHANVFWGGIKRESLSLDENLSRSYRVEKGIISLIVQNGHVWVSDSSCRQKICSSIPPISWTGERIICAPNNFLVEVPGAHFVDTVIR